ncbi:MAG: amidohydrolase family protein [Gammaproteobacteria bacterium]
MKGVDGVKRFVCLLALSIPVASAAALPLDTTRTLSFTTSEGSWMSVDVSPDGRRIAFDLLGDLYTIRVRGGTASPLLTGPAFESQPVWSPDGRRIAFISDRDGNENLWTASADGSDLHQLSFLDDNTEFMSPAWSSDGAAIFVSRLLPAVGAAQIWRYDADGGRRITENLAGSTTPADQRPSAVGVALSPDGRYAYYASRAGHSPREWRPWQIVRLELESGTVEPAISTIDGAARPVLSPDGRSLAYASRRSGLSSLRLRNLASGADQELVHPIQLDQHGAWATMDVTPRFSFTPDGQSIVFTRDARLHRVDIASGRVVAIPFEAPVTLGLGPSLRREIPIDEGPVRARLIQAPTESPDGTRIAFSALTHLYTMALVDGAAPARVTDDGLPAFQPSWSRDGRWLTYVTWDSRDGGHVWRVHAGGGRATRVTADAAYYTNPVFTPDGRHILALRSSHHERLRVTMEYGPFRQAELVALPIRGGTPRVLRSGSFGGPAQFVGDRMYQYGADGLASMAMDGTDYTVHARITGAPYYFEEGRTPVKSVRVNADGTRVLAEIRSQAYLLPLPAAGGAVADIDVTDPSATRLTDVGADFIGWSAAGGVPAWAVGSTYYRGTDAYPAVVEVPRDRHDEALVLRGATAITMIGEAAIEDADVVIIGNRIVAVGPRGTVVVPADAHVRDVSGRFIIPGLIDAHAHWADIRRSVLERQPYSVLANLAYGVTAGLDVSTLTIDMLVYQDMIAAGLTIGLRTFSTGPGVFSFNDFQSRDEVVDVLTRYRDHYRVTNVKQYRVGNRRQRQWFASVAGELELMPTTEGADNFKLSITQVLDGFAGVEHALPTVGLGRDVVTLLADSGTAYTPTLSVSDSSAFLGRMITGHSPLAEPKTARFLPRNVLDEKTRRVTVLRDDQYLYPRQARDVATLRAASALIGVGSHSEFHGIGFHWELEALASGGLSAREVLALATRGSAEVIGRAADLGAIAPGKLADLVILTHDPRRDIRNARAIESVMKNGRLYDGDTLDEVWPRERPLSPLWFWKE